jgi:predicted SAM-dependent methyltransferase
MKKILKNLIGPIYRIVKTNLGKQRLKREAKNTPCKIVIGASDIFEEGWIPTEVSYLNLLDEKTWSEFFKESSVDAIIAEHVWEHLTLAQGELAAANCFKYLKKGGYLRCAVPDGLHPDPEYIEYVRPGGNGNGADDHKILYTYHTFKAIFEKAGFQVNLLEYFDESGTFQFNEWDVKKGKVRRSKRFDPRNAGGELKYTSLIVDAIKP